MRIRPEEPRDHEAVHDVLAQAFPSDAEARLVRALRGATQGRGSYSMELDRYRPVPESIARKVLEELG